MKVFIVSFTLILCHFYISNSYVFPWEKQNVIQTTLEWGGLYKLPSEIKNLTIEKRGNPFTRQFIIEFEVNDPNEIDLWIKQSKRLKDNFPKINSNVKIYEVYPGEQKSIDGTVEIQGEKVKINMSWS
ncbi:MULTISPECIES: hypothetical protein [unclassified Tenacibaculum]|uniref:hypothetical protein n=1 Tax=unclassified Tenacibaculum TaxID=2635139 RepID=UPI001F16267E|nr:MULTISPECIES: hypothetical protein [unclassified Tenacibaculum]MCF2875632.1 hypothetical protein [Tenacibaculum sp. Cn5-1]MCF2935708.1 hypothetical protein [Tenacibaculum sp. Cn5-34]MCG7512268.1 hypothetical protein [Tenacibaculum sp. Cn5-46]